MGHGENNSPLFRLFQAFRRSNPHNRRSGGWSRLFVVPENERAQAMSKRFEAGESEYQTDQKWWELVEEADAEVLMGEKGSGTTAAHLGEEPAGTGDEKLGGEPEGESSPNAGGDPQFPPIRARVATLSQQYADDLTGQRYDVEAFAVETSDPALAGLGSPWTIRRTTGGPWEFFVDMAAPAFRSMTLTPLDALLAQLAWLISDFERGQGSNWTFGAILNALRVKYASASLLDPQDLIAEAFSQLTEVARSIVGRIAEEDARAFFDGLSPARQEAIRVAMAARGIANPHGAIDDGRFLQYSPPTIISDFVHSNPALFFDGNYWDEPFATLDYGSPAANDEARSRVLGYSGGLLADAVWLAQQAPSDLEQMSRERLMRASLASALLAPTSSAGEAV
jgi:hypothetical protein